jgi:hypothetical protein
MRRLILPLLLCGLLLCSPVLAQSPPSPQAAPQNESPESPEEEETFPDIPADDAPAGALEDEKDTGQGETSWERMKSEREPEVTPPPSEEPPETFSPLVLWRMLRSIWEKD